jgi:serine/threonine-protein kinase
MLKQCGMSPAEGDVIASRFQLVRKLAQGGMGSVWLANHLTLEVRCAVKLIAAEVVNNPKYIAQFHIEARAIAQVQSRHVVRVLDHDMGGDVPYIAMEFLDGEDLRTRLGREGRLGPHATYVLVSQIARGLSKAHAAGIVHRDLKPENVFLTEEDGEVVVKVLDFGVATWAAALLSTSGGSAEGLVGTPEYMSPEQTRGTGSVDQRADVWALAVIAFECLTGRLPFEGATLSEIFGRITAEAPLAPSEIAPDLPPGVDGWWLRAVSKGIDGRFQSARELACAFGDTLGIDGAGTSTIPPPLPETLPEGLLPIAAEGSWHRRLRRRGHPVAALGLMVVLVLPFADRAYGRGGRSDAAAFQAHHAEEVTGKAPRPTMARVEVAASRPALAETEPAATRPTGPPRQTPSALAPRAAGPSHAKPLRRDDADGVLAI